MLVHLVKGNYELVGNVNKNVSTTFMPPARHLTSFFIWLWFGYTFGCAVPTFVHMQLMSVDALIITEWSLIFDN